MHMAAVLLKLMASSSVAIQIREIQGEPGQRKAAHLHQMHFKIPGEGYEDHFLRGTEPLLSPDEFLQKHKCTAEPTLAATFKALKEKGVRMEDALLQEGIFKSSDLVKIFIQDQHIFENHLGKGHQWLANNLAQYTRLLRDLASEVQLPNVSFSLFLGDRGSEEEKRASLGLSRYRPGTIFTEGMIGDELLMLPRSLVLDSEEKKTEVCSDSDRFSTNASTSFAVFRGSQSGNMHQYDTMDGTMSLRHRLAVISLRRPDLLDVGFTEVGDRNNGYLTDRQQSCYSAIIVADGNSVPDRLPRQLALGKPVVLIHDEKVGNEFWYPELQPWKHYVPASLSSRMEDLTASLEKLQAEPAVAAQIGKAGQDFVYQRLTEDRIRCYLFNLLTGIANLSEHSA